MKKVALAKVKDHLSEYLRDAAKEEVVITRHGRPAGVLIGFESEDDWFEYRLENDPRFLKRIARARASIRAGRGIPWEDVQADSEAAAELEASDKLPTRGRRRPGKT
ncbi:prevent-host-death protein [candidate division WOR-3 bacterium JGI_Cruoil_03_51_56]|uniref:Antitoxin n=1 Tax=candidate division WOR-3 bacterium JGI_Cruoil_03_51_56 TaxID=1973747 RepID=A0A235BQF9_UNCW3|nr:MAG: prevent-host-death protein [candidate division WOR-3 bacterium JGI_Cruoil_03_51_56]